jgi:hypothetical protein
MGSADGRRWEGPGVHHPSGDDAADRTTAPADAPLEAGVTLRMRSVSPDDRVADVIALARRASAGGDQWHPVRAVFGDSRRLAAVQVRRIHNRLRPLNQARHPPEHATRPRAGVFRLHPFHARTALPGRFKDGTAEFIDGSCDRPERSGRHGHAGPGKHPPESGTASAEPSGTAAPIPANGSSRT